MNNNTQRPHLVKLADKFGIGDAVDGRRNGHKPSGNQHPEEHTAIVAGDAKTLRKAAAVLEAQDAGAPLESRELPQVEWISRPQLSAARPGKRAARFTEPGMEAAVAGAILTGVFDNVSEHALIPEEAFNDPRWRIVYRAGCALRADPDGACGAEAVNHFIAIRDLDVEMQEATDSTNTISWQTWPQTVGDCPTTRVLEYYLKELAYVYQKRRLADFGKRLESGRLDLKEAKAEWGEILHRANGASFNFEALDERRFDMARLHERPEAVFKLAGQSVSTPGNLTSIFAQAKAGKTAVIGAIIGAAAMAPGAEGDFLSWSSSLNLEEAALIHFDSEQSPYDHEQVVFQAMKRAGLKEPPPWLYSYCLTDLGVAVKWAAIPHELERAQKRHGAIFAVIIDGLGDFVLDTNSAEEANTVVAALHALAIKYNTVVVIVLHENPDSTGKGNVKMRGHLGSHMERKSESNIRLVKDKNEVTTQFTGRSRHAAISEAKGPRFSFDPGQGIHVSIGTAEETATKDDRRVVAEIFKGALGGLTWTQCHERIEKIEGLKRAGARKRFDRYLRLKLIVENPNYRENYIEKHG